MKNLYYILLGIVLVLGILSGFFITSKTGWNPFGIEKEKVYQTDIYHDTIPKVLTEVHNIYHTQYREPSKDTSSQEFSTSFPWNLNYVVHNPKGERVTVKDSGTVYVYHKTDCNEGKDLDLSVNFTPPHPITFIQTDTLVKYSTITPDRLRPVDYWLCIGRNLTQGKYGAGAGIEIPVRIPFVKLPDISVSGECGWFGSFNAFVYVNYHF